MIRDLGAFAWKVGLLFIVLLPLLYAGQFALLMGGPESQSGPLVQGYLAAMSFVPSMLISVGLGVIICLLVRIEAALRAKA
jgi:hypothetical protein